MVKMIDCGIVVREFELQSRYYVHFQANTFILLIVPLLFFEENGFGIKWPTTVDMPLNKETKPNPLAGAVEYTDCFSAEV